ncbi:MAG: hypothetical protein QM820_36560 [Minicystis sp.]
MRIPSFLAVSAMLVALGAGCALDHGNGGDVTDQEPGLAASDDPIDDPGLEYGQFQTPPVKIRIIMEATTQLGVLALRTEIGPYAGGMEHWFAPGGARLTNALKDPQFAPSPLTMEALPLSLDTEESIAEWAYPLGVAFSCRREVRAGDWSNGLVRIPDGAKGHLYATPHPDDDRLWLGLLLVTDETDQLRFSAWYRNAPPDDTGRAFSATRWSQPLTPVVDEHGNPTVDPNVLAQGDWYSIVMAP